MKSLLTLVTSCICLCFAGSSIARVEKVSTDLRAVYRQLEGRSLSDAIAELDRPQRLPAAGYGNVVFRLNGGGLENHVFIGERNTLEFLIVNDDELTRFSLACKFSASFRAIDWVEDYGLVPHSNPHRGIIKVNSAVVPAGFVGGALVRSVPDSILYGGAFFSAPYIAVHNSPALLFSMQFDVPSGASETSAANGGFCLDNVFMPPAGTWEFSPLSGPEFAPRFQSELNTSTSNPDAPDVCFDVIHRQLCQTTFKNKNIVPVEGTEPEPEYAPVQARAHHSILIDDSDEPSMGVLMIFKGNISDLEAAGVSVHKRRYSADRIFVRFPVKLLPQVVRVPGVELIYSGSELEEKR